jgi:hypothetical protein
MIDQRRIQLFRASTEYDLQQRMREAQPGNSDHCRVFSANAAKNDPVLSNETAQGTLALHAAMADTLDP